MNYTSEQYALMKLFEGGVITYDLTDEQKEIMFFLESEKLLQHRAYIQDGFCVLSERGKCVLEEHRRKVEAAKVQTRKELDALLERESIRQEDIHREKAVQQDQLNQIAADKAERQAEKRADRKFQITLTFINTIVSFCLGILAEHFGEIVSLVSEFFS